MHGFFCAMEMRAAPALPSILFDSIASAPHYGSSWDACVSELSPCLNLRFEVSQESCGRPCAAFFAPLKCEQLQRCHPFSLLPSSSAPHYGSSWDACVPELSPCLNLRFEVS
jgi:hypothetical protein